MLLPGCRPQGLHREQATCRSLLPHLWRPGPLDELWVEHLLPSVQALHICPVIEVLGCAHHTQLHELESGNTNSCRAQCCWGLHPCN